MSEEFVNLLYASFEDAFSSGVGGVGDEPVIAYVAELQGQIAERDTLIEQLIKAGHMLIGDATDWWGGEAVENWNALTEYWATKTDNVGGVE